MTDLTNEQMQEDAFLRLGNHSIEESEKCSRFCIKIKSNVFLLKESLESFVSIHAF